MKSSLEWFALVACFGLLSLCTVAAAEEDKYPERNAAAPAVTPQSIRGTFQVGPGQSIQAAVDRARPGDRIQVLPGTYSESVTIDFDDIELVGIVQNGERPVFDGKGKMNDAVLVSGNNFVISGFEVRDYKGNGVVVNKAKNATFRNLVCHNTGKYGVYPVLCQGVLVENCVVSDVWDAGVYAGQCQDVVIQNCESYRCTIGMETENCVNVLMANNSAHQNSLGLLVVLLPDLPTTVASNARVINNRVLDNNYPNLSPPGNTVNLVEPGIGIAVNAADNTEVTKNEVRGHGSYGIAMYALTDVFPPEHKLNVEPNPDGNYIHDNALADNGQNPSKRLKSLGAPGGDLFWSGKGVGNGWNETTEKSFPAKLPAWSGNPGAAGGGR
ncbi:MAG TPA: parallel beta-helix domain-containing protein [Pirellulales bacterium]|nr:parallel beta-helix domain-containing protein [Pirellulales bacterium]